MRQPTSGARTRRRTIVVATPLLVVPLLLGFSPSPAPASPPAPVATQPRIKAITYNVGDGSDAAKRADLRRLIALQPHVIGLQEVADRKELVEAVARNNGYRAIYEDASHHNAVLVRRSGVELLGHGARQISARSRVSEHTPGSSDGWHPAKYVNWVRLRTGGMTWVAGVVHLVPSAARYPLNEELHRTQVANSAEWFRTRAAQPLLMGDFNATPESSLMAGLRSVAKPWSAPSHGTRAIDHHWSRKDVAGRVAALADPDYSSDHRPVRVVLAPPATASRPAARMAVAVAGAADESGDFRFPGADLMRVPGSRTYVAYGASIAGNRLPYTRVEFRDGTFQRRSRIDGNGWADVRLPDGYWAEPGSHLWTPAVFPHRGADGRQRYFLFYSAKKLDATKHCIGYATSTRWDGGWRPSRDALFCAQDAWAIDADVTRGEGGVWLTLRNGDWTRNRITALGAARLRFDARGGVSLASPVKILDNEHLEWTHHQSPAGDVLTVENPNAVWMDRRWYLFYSGNNWYANRYSTGVAFCGEHLADGPCRAIAEPRAWFAYRPDPDGAARFRPGLPADMRRKTLPGNKRGPGAFDAFQAPDGSWWASWNYITDASPLTDPVRQSRIGRLTRSGHGTAADFTVTWR